MTRRKDPDPEAAGDTPDSSSTGRMIEAVEPVVEQRVVSPEMEATPAPRSHRTGFFLPLLGGAIAAAGGFAVAQFNPFGLAPNGPPSEVVALVDRLDHEIAESAGLVRSLRDDFALLSRRLEVLEEKPAAEEFDLTRIVELEKRLAATEAMPVGDGAANPAWNARLVELERQVANLAGVDAMLAEIEAALLRLDEANSEADSLVAASEAAATMATRSLALDKLEAAVREGRPFTAELADLSDPKLSTTLLPFAESGIAALSELKARFPDAARDTLRLSRELSEPDGWTERLTDFLTSQTGARPLTPQEGDSPAAILSRAEFSLTEDRVVDALNELQSLKPEIKGPMESWISSAAELSLALGVLLTAREE